jgi:hypothetical protein
MKCEQEVTRDSWHFHPCGKPAKFTVNDSDGKKLFMCGIHAKKKYYINKKPIAAQIAESAA